MYSPQITPFQPSNIDATTKMLMGLQQKGQLQQYVAQHKNDPNLVSLALYVSNMSKARPAVQAEANQPKVVDQAIAGMAQALPEDQGIATLPAQNMQNFAGGGIVAFDEGGEVPGYYEGALIGQGFRRDQMLPPPASNRNALIAGTMSNIAAQSSEDELKRIETQLQTMPPSPQRDYLENRKRILLGSPAAPTASPAPAPAATPYDPATATRRDMFVDPTAPPSPPTRVAAAKPPAPVAPATPVDALAGLPSLKTTAPTAEQAKRDAATLSDDTELRNALATNETFVKGAYAELLGNYDKKVAEMPEAYKGYEERLKKEEAAAETDKDKALGMSIFRAGLGMLAGTSQYAFENIGKGALTGMEDYQSALKDLKKAQRERDKAFADIEQARLAEKRGDIKTHIELQAKGIEALGAAKNRTVDGIAKIFDVDTRTATGIFETGMKDLAQNERTIYSAGVDLKKQGMADTAAMERIKAQTASAERVAKTSADTYKLPMLYKAVEDSVDKMLQADMNYRAADEATKTTMRNNALQKRLRATPGLAQYADAAAGGGGGEADFVYQNGQLVPRKP